MDPAEYQAWQLEQFVNLLAKVGMVSISKHTNCSLGYCLRSYPDTSAQLPLLWTDSEGKGSAYTIILV